MTLLRQIKTVLWGFIGIGGRQGTTDAEEAGNPLVLVLIVFIIALLLLGTLALIAHVAAGR